MQKKNYFWKIGHTTFSAFFQNLQLHTIVLRFSNRIVYTFITPQYIVLTIHF